MFVQKKMTLFIENFIFFPQLLCEDFNVDENFDKI